MGFGFGCFMLVSLGIVFAGALIAGSHLCWSRYACFYNPSTNRLTRADRATGEVYFFDHKREWINIRVPSNKALPCDSQGLTGFGEAITSTSGCVKSTTFREPADTTRRRAWTTSSPASVHRARTS